MALSFINTSGNIISEDFCNQLLIETKAEYVKSKSFGDDVKKVDEDIATSFELLRERWEEIRVKVLDDQFDNTQLRDRWIKPFLSMLGFDPTFNPHNLKNNAGVEYQIPYRGDESLESPVIHMVLSSNDLDARDKTSRTHPIKSPHDLLQQYLNTSSHKWAILINGKKVRILRDFYHSITKGFIEFDLESIFESASTEQFRILYRLMHRSRFDGQYEKQTEESDEPACLLEKFHTLSRDTGVKVGDNLRKQVRIAIETLGNGFAENLNPDEFDEAEVKKFYSEILNIIYRLLFLLFAEQKGWLPVKNDIYARTYSINALRERAERGDFSHDNHQDLWEGLKVTFRLVTKGYTFPNGDKINAFGGQLFSDDRIFYIKSPLRNKHLLIAIESLCFFTEKGLKNKINYATLAIDELGSVYESLLDYEPRLLKENTEINGKVCKRGEFVLDDRSTERKTTGSYYTDSRLVAQLIDSALVPVIENALKDKPTNETKRAAILELKVADIACGSGAFLIAALEKMGEYMALIGKEEGEKPTEDELRQAKREVLQNCIYGVDLNPMALELAKFSLWITASMPNFPLSFLDHKLKCGNSLVGATPELIEKGIPVEAFNPVTLDNKVVCADLKKRVKKELTVSKGKGKGMQTKMEFKVTVIENDEDSSHYLHILHSQQEDADEVENVAHEYKEIYRSLRANAEWKLADAWTAAFFITKDNLSKVYPTNVTLKTIKRGGQINEVLESEILDLARKYRFFHWHLEYPEVFEKASTEHGRSGGFDCILGNPPWERVKLQEKEFFATRDRSISDAISKDKRKKMIENLKANNQFLYKLFLSAKSDAEKFAQFLLKSERYPLLGKGDVNTYTVFTENFRNNISPKGRMGIIVPTGIATDDTTKDFFQDITKKENLVSLYDFENKEKLFDIHRSFKFCLLTIAGYRNNKPFDFLFFATNPINLLDDQRHFSLTSKELFAINPNTGNCPTFRNKQCATIVRKIYSEAKILRNEKCSDNYFKFKYLRMFDMANDSNKFKTTKSDNALPLFEAKMFWQYDHRFGTFDDIHERGNTHLVKTQLRQYQEQNYEVTPAYYVENRLIEERFESWKNKWVLGFRRITNSTNERTSIFCILPQVGSSDSVFLMLPEKDSIRKIPQMLGNFNSIVFDFICRQKLAGLNMNFFIVDQLPYIEVSLYSNTNKKILENILKLTYTSLAIKPFAEDLGYFGEPFVWIEEERFQIKCELDAIYGHLYSLSSEEFGYILETFPIVKRRDIEKYGSYRTKDTILKLFDEMDWVKDEMEKTESKG